MLGCSGLGSSFGSSFGSTFGSSSAFGGASSREFTSNTLGAFLAAICTHPSQTHITNESICNTSDCGTKASGMVLPWTF